VRRDPGSLPWIERCRSATPAVGPDLHRIGGPAAGSAGRSAVSEEHSPQVVHDKAVDQLVQRARPGSSSETRATGRGAGRRPQAAVIAESREALPGQLHQEGPMRRTPSRVMCSTAGCVQQREHRAIAKKHRRGLYFPPPPVPSIYRHSPSPAKAAPGGYGCRSSKQAARSAAMVSTQARGSDVW